MKALFTAIVCVVASFVTGCSLSRGNWDCDGLRCSFNTNGEVSRVQEEITTENGESSSSKESD